MPGGHIHNTMLVSPLAAYAFIWSKLWPSIRPVGAYKCRKSVISPPTNVSDLVFVACGEFLCFYVNKDCLLLGIRGAEHISITFQTIDAYFFNFIRRIAKIWPKSTYFFNQ